METTQGQVDNNDGMSIYDITDPAKRRYGFVLREDCHYQAQNVREEIDDDDDDDDDRTAKARESPAYTIDFQRAQLPVGPYHIHSVDLDRSLREKILGTRELRRRLILTCPHRRMLS